MKAYKFYVNSRRHSAIYMWLEGLDKSTRGAAIRSAIKFYLDGLELAGGAKQTDKKPSEKPVSIRRLLDSKK